VLVGVSLLHLADVGRLEHRGWHSCCKQNRQPLDHSCCKQTAGQIAALLHCSNTAFGLLLLPSIMPGECCSWCCCWHAPNTPAAAVRHRAGGTPQSEGWPQS
jgi:hypothetical protein